MTGVLTPAYSLVLGSQRWTQQVVDARLVLAAAPSLNTLNLRLPASAPLSADLGDVATLSFTNDEQDETVFSGTIAGIDHRLDAICVAALDAGGLLAQFRPNDTYEQVTAGNVTRYLCDGAGVDPGDIADGVALVYYAADSSRTALEHITRVSAWSGAMARVSADNRLETVVVNATQADLALKFGRELHSIHSRRLSAPVKSFTIAGESGVGDTAAADAFRPSTDFFAGNRPPGPSLDRRWRSEPALRTASAAGTAGAALQRGYTAGRERGTLEAFLLPKLRPGTIVEVHTLPDGLPSGPLWLHRVQHSFGPRGAVTRADFYKGGDSFDPMALLGSLSGAIGGLL
jgi:hypothetical protein